MLITTCLDWLYARLLKSSSILAGYVSRGSNPILSDFILLAQKLEKLGFTHNDGTVVATGYIEESDNV